MDAENSGNQPPPDPIAQPAAVKLQNEILRKQQVLRRHLQDPASPAFNDPIHAAELAGFPVMRQSHGDPDPDGGPTYFYNDISIRKAILDAASHKAATIEKLRRRVSEGMDATKILNVSDHDGARRSVEVPDQAARRGWALVCARLENLLPGKGGDPSSDRLPHEAALAERLEKLAASDVGRNVSRMNPADRFQVSQALVQLEHLKGSLRQQVMAEKLGKSTVDFQDEVEQEVSSRMKQFISRVCPKPASSDSSQIATEGKP